MSAVNRGFGDAARFPSALEANIETDAGADRVSRLLEAALASSPAEVVQAAQKLVLMGERTCFLHAAMRGAYPTQIRLS